MATKLQYEFFKSMHEAEYLHYGLLEARARLYLTLQTFYLGAVAFKFNDVVAFTNAYNVPVLPYIAAAVLLLIGLFFTVRATCIRSYEVPCDLTEIVKSFGNSPQTDDDFIDQRLGDFAVASKRNAAVNNRVATWLTGASWLLATAIFLHLTVFVWAYITQIKL